eukprot:2488694-Pleurochrysis_carterae.AAC.1
MATYTDADFAVGKQVNINGCEFLIYGWARAASEGRCTHARPRSRMIARACARGCMHARAHARSVRLLRSLLSYSHGHLPRAIATSLSLLPAPPSRFSRNCDEFTRDYYDKVYGEHFEDIPVEFDESVERPQARRVW